VLKSTGVRAGSDSAIVVRPDTKENVSQSSQSKESLLDKEAVRRLNSNTDARLSYYSDVPIMSRWWKMLSVIFCIQRGFLYMAMRAKKSDSTVKTGAHEMVYFNRLSDFDQIPG